MIYGQMAKYVSVTPPAAIIDNAAVTTTEVDCSGWDHAEIMVYIGATDIAMTVLKVQESDTSGSGFADVTGLIGGTSTDIDGSTSVLPSATADNGFHVFHVDLRKRKRYLDIGATVGDGTAGTYIAISARLSRGEIGPDSVSDHNCNGLLRA